MMKKNSTFLMLLMGTMMVSTIGGCQSTKKLSKVTQIGIEQNLVPAIFKVAGVGYQGPSQKEIDKLPVFTVNPTENATKMINKAILEASKSKNGGRVVLNPGRYVVDGLVLKSNVHILMRAGVLLRADQDDVSKRNQVKQIFEIGTEESLENVSIIGEGKGDTRARIKYVRENSDPKKGGSRAFSTGRVQNLFIQNVVIDDDQTRFSGVAFTFKKGDNSKDGCATNVTVDNVEQINALYGYGLIQANTGSNMLLSNLVCSGGVAARIETDNRGREAQIKVGVDNIRIENVTSVKGKCAVYFKPHNLVSGTVTVDGAHSIGSQLCIEIRDGREGGRFAADSWIKNVTAVYTLDAPVHFSGKSSIPNCLLSYFKDDIKVDAENKGVRQGPSIAVIGDYVGQIKIDKASVSASVPAHTELANTVAARVLIVTKDAYRGKDADKQCGEKAY
ncbi:hypothetical protein [Flavobacterium faecale]|nr:hypothetical protein [Flavobacterium faecale]